MCFLSSSLRFRLAGALALLFTFALAVSSLEFATARAQEDSSYVQKWEFGLEITATGDSSGIVASVPIPINWPEQKVSIIDERKGGADRFTYKNLGDEAAQLVISINKMDAGTNIRASVVMEIVKTDLAEHPHASALRLPTRSEVTSLNRYLKPSPYIEMNHRIVKAFGDSIDVDSTKPAYEQVRSIYESIRERIPYEFDETIRTCMEAIERGTGDCEELSSLFIAVCRQRGIPARAVWIPEHTYPEFYLVDEKGQGHWIPCQIAGSYEFGSMSEPKPILQKGDNFKIPGNPARLRYVQPTLTARDATGSPALRWIMQPLD